MSSTVEREYAIADPAGVLECFEATAQSVFASLCRVTVGDRSSAERLLRTTYIGIMHDGPDHPDGEITEQRLILTAHRLYLDEAIADDEQRPVEPHGMESEWSRERWGVVLDTLAELSPEERAAVHLHYVEHFPLDAIASCLNLTHDETLPLLASGCRALAEASIDEPIPEVFRHAEIWLDDSARDQVRKALTERAPVEAERRHRRTWSTPTARVRLAAVAAGIFLLMFIRWALVAPRDEGTAGDPPVTSVSADGAPDASSDSGTIASLTPGVYGTGTSRRSFLPPTPGSSGESINLLALHLKDEQLIRPDAIIKYSNGKVGIQWHGPCNRPAARVQLSNLDNAVGLRLTTGAFPVASCVGMPDRWVTVIETPMELSPGPILPLNEDNTLDDTFDGYSEKNTGNVRTELFEDSAWSASALMDGSNRAWTFVEGCPSSRSLLQYDSPVGPLFEINIKNDNSLATCEESPNQRLVSSGGVQFPQPEDKDGKPIRPTHNCRGPVGSMTSLSEGPADAGAIESDWTTSDGCIVRDDVISSQSPVASYTTLGERTITIAATIGTRVSAENPAMTYVRDGEVSSRDGRLASDPNNGLSRDAYDTGLRHHDDELWISPGNPNVIYTVKGSMVATWSLVGQPSESGPSG